MICYNLGIIYDHAFSSIFTKQKTYFVNFYHVYSLIDICENLIRCIPYSLIFLYLSLINSGWLQYKIIYITYMWLE